MSNNQKETLVAVATVATVALVAYGFGKVTGKIASHILTKKFDKAMEMTNTNSE